MSVRRECAACCVLRVTLLDAQLLSEEWCESRPGVKHLLRYA
jgi:hypothetical protein